MGVGALAPAPGPEIPRISTESSNALVRLIYLTEKGDTFGKTSIKNALSGRNFLDAPHVVLRIKRKVSG